MRKSLKVNADNLQVCESVRTELVARLEEIASMTKRYPVECIFEGFRFVFASREDIQELIQMLSTQIESYKQAA